MGKVSLHYQNPNMIFSSIMIKIHILAFIVSIIILKDVHSSRVLELSDGFIDMKNDGHWFIMFYAPWCAHCKKIEPIWRHVAQALHHTDIRVGRIDCTRYTKVISKFELSGYPTIMLDGGGEFQFNSDRSTAEMVHFAKRLARPPVQEVTDSNDIEMLKQTNKNFFMFIGKSVGHTWDLFYDLAKHYQAHSYFYITSETTGKQHFDFRQSPAVVVYKEEKHYSFNAEEWDNDFNTSFTQWVNTERFDTFVKVTRSNILNVLETNKYLVLALVEENKIQKLPPHHSEFLQMVESVIVKNRERFHRDFQFGWIGSPEFASVITISEVTLPSLIIFNSTTRHLYFPDEKPHELTPESITSFLEAVRNQSVKAYGGNGIFTQMYRLYFETKTLLVNIWTNNPTVASVLFGLPLGFLSLICYSTCCTDVMDASDDEEEDIHHEKKE